MSVAELFHSIGPSAVDFSCYDGRQLQVSGWVAPPWGIGGEATFIEPAWLAELPWPFVLWEKPMVSDGCYEPDDCMFLLIHINPATGLTLAPDARWVIVTGHYSDPVAETCAGVGPNFQPELFPDPRAFCRWHFVLEAVVDAD